MEKFQTFHRINERIQKELLTKTYQNMLLDCLLARKTCIKLLVVILTFLIHIMSRMFITNYKKHSQSQNYQMLQRENHCDQIWTRLMRINPLMFVNVPHFFEIKS